MCVIEQDHEASDLESATDGADVSNANEFDEELKDEAENKKIFQTNDINEPEIPETREIKADILPPAQEMKIEFSGNQENSDAVEDCINLNVEDEENFEEVSV